MTHRHRYTYLLGENVSTTGPSTIVEQCRNCCASTTIGFVGLRRLEFFPGHERKRHAVKQAFAERQRSVNEGYRMREQIRRAIVKKLTVAEREAVGL